MVATCGGDPAGIRDGASRLLRFAAALRRSDVAALKVNDMEQTRDGSIATLRRTKIDQEAAGRRRRVPSTATTIHRLGHTFATLSLDAGASLRDWQDAAGDTDPRTTTRYDRARHNLGYRRIWWQVG